MKRIPDTIKTDIRTRINLAEVISEAGVELKRSGKDWRGRCPFEPGSTNPSKFAVNERTYYCYGCEASGDIFTWLQEWWHLRFPDAVAEAARLANLTLPPFDSESGPSAQAPRDDAQAQRIRACNEALVTIADLSQTTALRVPDRELFGVQVDPLIETGELGFLPDSAQIYRRLDAIGIGPETRADAGVFAALEQLAGQWILWARRQEHIVGGRKFGDPQLTVGYRIGSYGCRTHGWIQAPAGERGGRHVLIAGDDMMYVALRLAGIGGVYRPLSTESLNTSHNTGHDGPRLDSGRLQPVYLLRPTGEARRNAFDDLVHLLTVNARLRVAEFDPQTVPLHDGEIWRATLDRTLEQGGTAFDWQTQVLAAHRAFETHAGRLGAATRLAQLATAATSDVERLTYLLEIKVLTGVSQELSNGVSRTGEHTAGPVVRARNRRDGIAV